MSLINKIESLYLIPSKELVNYCDVKNPSFSEGLKARTLFLVQAITSTIALPIILFIGTLEAAGYLFFNIGDKDCPFEILFSFAVVLGSIPVSAAGIFCPQIASVPFNMLDEFKSGLLD